MVMPLRQLEPSEKTEPPHQYENVHSFHWLWAERSSRLSIAEWHCGDWYCSNEQGVISPAEVYRRGWRYHSPCKMPNLPEDHPAYPYYDDQAMG